MENRHRAASTTTRTSPSPRCSARRRCARRSRRSTPSPAPPTTWPTKATPARASGWPRWRPTAPTSPRPRPGAPASALAARVRAARRRRSLAHRLPVELLDALLDAFIQDVTVSPLRRSRRRCSTTAGAPPIRSAGCCCISTASAAAEHLARSDAICTALQLANFWQDLGVDTRRGRLYLPEADCRRHGIDPLDLLAGKDSAAVARPGRRCRRMGARADALRRAPGPRGAGPRRLGAAPGGPGRTAHPRADRPARRRDPAAATEARLERRAGDRLARPGDAPREGRGERARRVMGTTARDNASMTPEQYVQDKAAASGSSFYYAFLFLPPPRRAAITAFYAFCREVDDVVDEVSDRGVAAAKLAWWQRRGRRELGRQAEPSGDARAAAAHRRLRHRAEAPAGGDRRLPDGPRPVALPRLRRPRALLRSRRRRRRRGRGQHLRPGERIDRRLRAPARPGDAAHQHRPRHRRRRPARPDLPADGRAEAVRRQGERAARSAATATASRR